MELGVSICVTLMKLFLSFKSLYTEAMRLNYTQKKNQNQLQILFAPTCEEYKGTF